MSRVDSLQQRRQRKRKLSIKPLIDTFLSHKNAIWYRSTNSNIVHDTVLHLAEFRRRGVNFTNILFEAFTSADHKSVKNAVKLKVFFALLGSAPVKAFRKMLVNFDEQSSLVIRGGHVPEKLWPSDAKPIFLGTIYASIYEIFLIIRGLYPFYCPSQTVDIQISRIPRPGITRATCIWQVWLQNVSYI